MPQRILEKLYEKIADVRSLVPELSRSLETVIKLNTDLMDREELGAEEVVSLKNAYENVRTAMTDLLQNPHGVPEDVQKYLSAVRAVRAPLDCYIRGLNQSPKNLKQVLSNTGWVKDYLGKAEKFEEDPDYVPDSFSTDGMSLGEAAEIYRTEAKKVQEGFVLHLERLSGEKEHPDEALNEKLEVLNQLIQSFEDEPVKSNFPEWAEHSYAQLAEMLELENVDSLDMRKGILLTSKFYEIICEKLYNYDTVSGFIEGMKTVDPETIRLLLAEAKKLRLTRENLGVGKRSEDILTKTGIEAGVFDNYYCILLMDAPEAEDNPEDPLFPILSGMKKFSAQVLDLLHGKPETKMPTAEELSAFLALIDQYVGTEDYLEPNGSLKNRMKYLAQFAQRLSKLYPALQNQVLAIVQKVRDRGASRFLALIDELADRPEEKKKKQILNSLRLLQSVGYVTKEQAEHSRFYSMAGNPEYRESEVDRATKGLRELLKFHGEFNSYGFFPDYTDFDGNTTEFDEAAQRREICRIILIGNVIRKQEESGLEIRDLHEYMQQFEGFDQLPVAQYLYSMSTDSLIHLISDEKLMKNVTDMILSHKKDYLADLDAETLANLSQEKGNLGSANSEQYNRIRESLHRAQQRNLTIPGAGTEEFHDLVRKCSDYLIIRSSSANSPNGKKRFSAAAKVLRTIGPKVAVSLPAEEQKEIQKDITVNMFRSKEFRRACMADAKERIISVFGGADKISNELFRMLGEEERKSLEQDVKLLTAANGVETVMKNAGIDQIMAGKITEEEDIEKINSYAERILAQEKTSARFTADPAAVLVSLTGRQHPAAVAEKGM